jgi:hypothetical protein
MVPESLKIDFKRKIQDLVDLSPSYPCQLNDVDFLDDNVLRPRFCCMEKINIILLDKVILVIQNSAFSF